MVESIKEFKKDPRTHSLLVDDQLHVQTSDGVTHEDVWAIGDASVLESVRLPATAQVAAQQSKYVAKCLNRLAKGKEVEGPFKYRNLGQLSYIGDWSVPPPRPEGIQAEAGRGNREAVYDRSNATSGPKNIFEGRVAWLLYRSAYFWQTLSVRNMSVVAYYWALNWVFGRDVARF